MTVKKNFFEKIIVNYYFIVLAIYLISLIWTSFPRALINAVLLVSIAIYCFKTNKFRLLKRELIGLGFIIICLLSSVMYLFNNVPFIIYIKAFSYSILPMFMLFIKDEKIYNKFFERTMSALMLSLIIGWLLYYFAPEFYGKYLVYHSYTSKPLKGWIQSSLQGIYGITVNSLFAACCSIYYYNRFINNKKKYDIFLFIISFITLLFGARRAPIMAFLISFIITTFIFLTHIKQRNKVLKYLFFTFVIIGIISFIKFDYVESIVSRVFNVSLAVNERSEIWEENLEKLKLIDYITGKGYGSKSHFVNDLGLLGVFDSNYILILVEIGIFGFIYFCFLILTSVFNGEKNNTNNLFILMIIIIFLIQAIGSNVLEFQSSAPLFWMCIGYRIHKFGGNCNERIS